MGIRGVRPTKEGEMTRSYLIPLPLLVAVDD
jgi:hypothetical protein